MRDRQFDEVGRQGLALLAMGDGGGQGRGVFGRNALTDIGPIAPDLMLKVRAGFGPGRLIPVFGLETALLHGLQSRHLFKNRRPLRVEFRVHFRRYV